MKNRIVYFLFLFIVSVSAITAAEKREFKAGAGYVDITPTVLDRPTQGNGTTVIADKVKDPISARCLLLHDGREQIMLLVVDVCHLSIEVVDRMKTLIHEKTGVPKNRIMISATHTHSAPLLRLKPSEGETKFTPENIVNAAIESYKNLVPAKIGWAVGNDPKNVFCRRFLMRDGAAPNNPAFGTKKDRAMMNPGTLNPSIISPTGPVDSLIPVVSVVSPEGMPIAVFANYSSHHAMQGLKADEISGDRFGVFAEEMKRLIAEKIGKEKVSDKFLAIMAQGTSGDANCRDFLNPKRKYDYVSVGRDNADAAMAVWPHIEYFDWVPLGMVERKVTVPGYKPTPEEVEAAKMHLADETRKKNRLLDNFVTSIATTKEWRDTVDVPLQAMRIGKLGMTTLPGEFFGLTGIDLKAKSPFQPTMNIGTANAGFSYVPPPEQFELGGYATWRSAYRCLGILAEPIIKENLLEMLQELHGKNETP